MNEFVNITNDDVGLFSKIDRIAKLSWRSTNNMNDKTAACMQTSIAPYNLVTSSTSAYIGWLLATCPSCASIHLLYRNAIVCASAMQTN